MLTSPSSTTQEAARSPAVGGSRQLATKDVLVRSWNADAHAIEQHPLAKIIPGLGGEALQKFKRSIQRLIDVPLILTFEGMVLDGWPEYQACIELGINPRFEEFIGDDNDAKRLVFTRCIERRAPSSSVRSMMLAVLYDPATAAGRGGRRDRGAAPLSTRQQRASEAGVGIDMQRKNEHVHRCCPHLVMEVIHQNLSPDAAYKLCTGRAVSSEPKEPRCRCEDCESVDCSSRARIDQLEQALREAKIAVPIEIRHDRN